MMQFQPLFDRVLARRDTEPEPTPGSLVVPDSAKEKPMGCTVLSVGPGRINELGNIQPMSVKVGDHVLVAKYAGAEIKVDGEELLILREDEVLGIVREEPARAAEVAQFTAAITQKFHELNAQIEGRPETPAERLEALRAIPRTTE